MSNFGLGPSFQFQFEQGFGTVVACAGPGSCVQGSHRPKQLTTNLFRILIRIKRAIRVDKYAKSNLFYNVNELYGNSQMKRVAFPKHTRFRFGSLKRSTRRRRYGFPVSFI